MYFSTANTFGNFGYKSLASFLGWMGPSPHYGGFSMSTMIAFDDIVPLMI
jgi:hypothetical protein